MSLYSFAFAGVFNANGGACFVVRVGSHCFVYMEHDSRLQKGSELKDAPFIFPDSCGMKFIQNVSYSAPHAKKHL